MGELTYPINLSAVIWMSLPFPAPVFLTISSRNVRNFHSAFAPAGVSSVLQVLKAMVPSDPAVAIIPCAAYSRSRKAKEVMHGRTEVDRNCNSAIRRAFTVCKHSFSWEHVAIFPFEVSLVDVSRGTRCGKYRALVDCD